MTLVVRRRRPMFLIAAAAATLALLAVLGWWLVDSERLRALSGAEALPGAETLREERDLLLQDRDALAEENRALARRVAAMERNRQVEAEAYQRVGRELVTLQKEILKLKEELAFYRGIVGDTSASGNVRIQRFDLEPDGPPRGYRYRLVLTRGIRSDNVASGAVTLAVDGDQDGEGLRLRLRDLTPDRAGPLQFSFKHFQRFEGRLRLPDRFVPWRVVVQVHADQDGTTPLREIYEWPSAES